MALLFKKDDCYLIDHREYITGVYNNTTVNENKSASFSVLAKLFSIVHEKEMKVSRKRGHNFDIINKEVSLYYPLSMFYLFL